MYCRRCGKKLDRNLIRCPHCGTDVVEVKQKAYSQVYEEKKQKEKEEKTAKLTNYPKEVEYKENQFVPYAVWTAVAAFLLAVFPWPKEWGIGTSIWMKLLILVIAIMSLFNCLQGNQISSYNKTQIEKYNKRHPKNTLYYEKPKSLIFANILAVLTAMLTTFSLFMG